MTEIPLNKWKCQDLITPDTLHAYCGGPKPTPEACHLNPYSCHRKFIHLDPFFSICVFICSNTRHLSFTKMEAARQRERGLLLPKKRKRRQRDKMERPCQPPRSSVKGCQRGRLTGRTTARPKRCPPLHGRGSLRSCHPPSLNTG